MLTNSTISQTVITAAICQHLIAVNAGNAKPGKPGKLFEFPLNTATTSAIFHTPFQTLNM